MPAIDCSRSRLWLFVIELAVAAVLGVVPLFARPPMAHAQATRTWVSGTGDDVNPCSRTAACKTFAGAIPKTAAGGEIDVLDPGGFGAVTLTKAVTIDGGGNLAGVLVSGMNGIGTGLNGIRFLSGKGLIIEKCQIYGFTQAGIDFEPSAASALAVNNTSVEN